MNGAAGIRAEAPTGIEILDHLTRGQFGCSILYIEKMGHRFWIDTSTLTQFGYSREAIDFDLWQTIFMNWQQ